MKNGTVKHHMIGFRTRQRGASLLEGIAYLGIAAIVILGAVSLLTNAFGNAQANRATEEVISLRTAVRKLYVGQVYPAGITATLINAGAIPATLTINGVNVTNSWGGAVTVVGNNNAGNVNSFAITYNNVPQAECINMLSGANGWTQVGAGAAGATVINAFPVTANAASNACVAGNNVVIFTAV